MARANRGTEPPAASARITATSLADTISRALRACWTVSFWPRFMARRRAGWRAAAPEATVMASRSRLARTASAVSILVRLAGGAGVQLRRPHSTAPVAGSTRIAYRARTPRAHADPGSASARPVPPVTTSRLAMTMPATSSRNDRPNPRDGVWCMATQCRTGRRAGQGRRSGYGSLEFL